MLRISHCSDNHGHLTPLSPLASLIVCSGDFLPNEAKGPSEVAFKREVEYQEFWVRQNISDIAEWLSGRPLLFSSGNHDFIDPCPILREFGLDAINIDNKIVEHSGRRFYGFPFVPWIQGRWNFELVIKDMVSKVEEMGKVCNEGRVDILVAHCPPYGILDELTGFYWGTHGGNTSLANLINYQWMPEFILSGHFHDAAGIRLLTRAHSQIDIQMNCIVSNAATKVHTFEID
jgi:Icc-related predicted phosphoesterase